MCASFCAGTRILTARGRVRVEKLRLNDTVMTLRDGPMPIRWIGQRIYGRYFARLNPHSVPIMIQRDAIDEGVPSRDVYISPLHNLFIDGILIPAEELLNGISITRCEEMDPIAYYSIELPVHAVVLADDLPAESYLDRGDRAMFVSTASIDSSEQEATQLPMVACAPIVQSGPTVDRVRASIALRAGITPPHIMDRPQDGPLLAKVEWIDRSMVSGWAWLPDHPDVPVVLEVVDNGQVIAVAVADTFRSDLRRTGIGTGHHAFHVELPRPLTPRQSHSLVVRRAADGLSFPGCPFDFPASPPSSALTDLDLVALIDSADLGEKRRVLEWLEQQTMKLHARMAAGEIAPPPAKSARKTVPVGEPRPRRLKPQKCVQA